MLSFTCFRSAVAGSAGLADTPNVAASMTVAAVVTVWGMLKLPGGASEEGPLSLWFWLCTAAIEDAQDGAERDCDMEMEVEKEGSEDVCGVGSGGE